MTEIERKALELVNEVCSEWDVSFATEDEMDGSACFAALRRAIEQHERFRQEVSDAVAEIAKAWGTADPAWGYLRRFIITKPDPLVEVLSEAGYTYLEADKLRAALAKRGLEIREKSE